MDEPSDATGLVITFPVWGIFAPLPGNPQLAYTMPNGQRSGIFFTEELLAERFRDSLPDLKGYLVKLVGDAPFFAKVLVNCKTYGINYVTIDPVDEQSAKTKAVPIAALRPHRCSD
jgi:hypothetical protein